ncbi:MAG: transposase family protein [Pseudomonadales bacterium]|nr:transposase family protein [Pseudomonadales bacterium]
MNLDDLEKIDDIQDFLNGTQQVIFKVLEGKDERYRWTQRTLVKFHYKGLRRQEKGLIIRFVMKVTGYSRAQTKRLIQQYDRTGKVKRHQQTCNGFNRRYLPEDIVLLAKMDELHEVPSGPIMKKLCERAYRLEGSKKFERLSTISVSHIYNLRHSIPYSRQRFTFEKTKKKAASIGERRKPAPNGEPGYLRIDTVHQGDLDGKKGVYHINAVDVVTQFEIVVTVEGISEAFLLPALQFLLEAFPFVIKGFHSDNGSEYINYKVAKLLEKMRVEFTKSRPRKSSDNALVESKNGSVVRKAWGYDHLPQRFAALINQVNQEHLNGYINFHRPCFFPETVVDKRGKEKKRYPYNRIMTPYQKLKSLDNAEQYLKEDMTLEMLDQVERAKTDSQAAEQFKQAKQDLYQQIFANTKKQTASA